MQMFILQNVRADDFRVVEPDLVVSDSDPYGKIGKRGKYLTVLQKVAVSYLR